MNIMNIKSLVLLFLNKLITICWFNNTKELWMKYLLALLCILCSLSVQAEKLIIKYGAEIYQVSKINLDNQPLKEMLNSSELIYSPSMLVYSGQTASMEFGEPQAMLKLEVSSDKKAELFSVSISSKNNEQETWQPLTTSPPKASIDGTIVIKGEILEKTYLFQISAEIAENKKQKTIKLDTRYIYQQERHPFKTSLSD